MNKLFVFISFTCIVVYRKIAVVFEMRGALLPLVNNKIHYYSIPHCFRFELYNGVCAMQYANFSTHRHYLPERPDAIPGKPSTIFVEFKFLFY